MFTDIVLNLQKKNNNNGLTMVSTSRTSSKMHEKNSARSIYGNTSSKIFDIMYMHLLRSILFISHV